MESPLPNVTSPVQEQADARAAEAERRSQAAHAEELKQLAILREPPSAFGLQRQCIEAIEMMVYFYCFIWQDFI